MKVLLLLLLGCSLAQGHPVDKCSLRAKIKEATKGMDKGLDGENFRAKIVCSVEMTTNFNKSAVNQTTPGSGNVVWKFYGLFQLGNRLACSDGTTPTRNICGKECNSFIDDEIDDDLQCLLHIFNRLLEEGFGADHFKDLRTGIAVMLSGKCSNNKTYFSDCP